MNEGSDEDANTGGIRGRQKGTSPLTSLLLFFKYHKTCKCHEIGLVQMTKFS